MVGNLRIHSLVSITTDNRPSVVLVHGLGVSGRYMIPTALLLAPFCQVFIPDLPGFGQSSKPGRFLKITELADCLAAWMQVSGIDKATLLGNSIGCQVIADLAVRHPERIEQIVLVGPTVDPERRSIRQQLKRLLIDAPREPISLLPIAFSDYLKAGFRRVLRTFQDALRDRIEERLPQINVPALVVGGELDPIAPRRWIEEVSRLLPEGQHLIIAEAAHAVNYNSPKELARAVLSFIC